MHEGILQEASDTNVGLLELLVVKLSGTWTVVINYFSCMSILMYL